MGCGCNKKHKSLPRSRMPGSARKFVKKTQSQSPTSRRTPRSLPVPGRKR